MPASFLQGLTRRQRYALGGLALCLVALVLFWLALPGIVQRQAERFVAEQTGHRLRLEPPRLSFFGLSAQFGKLELADPAGKPLLAFDGLLVDFSLASLPRRALAFDAIRLDGLTLTLAELPDGQLNWHPFLAALEDKDAPPRNGLPRLDIDNLVLAGGRLDFADRRGASDFATRIEPLDLTLSDLSTLPDDKGRYKLTARLATGARLDLEGELALNPLLVSGKLALADLDLAPLAPYLGEVLAAAPAGKAALSAEYRVGNGGERLAVVIDKLAGRLADLRLPLKTPAGALASLDSLEVQAGRFDLAAKALDLGAIRAAGGRLALPALKDDSPGFGNLTLEQLRVDLDQRMLTAGKLALADARLAATRDATGNLDLLAALRSAPARAAPATPATAPWRFKLEQVAATGLGIVLRDAGVSPPAELALTDMALSASGVGDDLNATWPINVAFAVRGGGRFEGKGTLVPGAPRAELQFKLSDLSLKPAQPYLSARTTLAIAGGTLSSQGRLVYGPQGPSFRGDFALRDLRLDEPNGNTLLAWKNFASGALTLTPERLDLGELRLGGLDTQLIIDKDKNINLKQVLRQAAAPSGEASAPAAAPAAAPFAVNIDRIRFYNGELEFADHSLLLPFGTRIHRLRGSIVGLSSRPGAPGQLELDGEVDDYGMARAVGQVDLFHPTDFMDLRVIFRNVEMTRLTPYTATFAGRKIDSGKLSLDLQYKLKQRQLQGENQVVMDRLVLGERVDSPTAKNLPLDLAIAILQDADGRIDLGLPVAGSLDDPEFSYGQIVWKAIANVLTKIVSAPFRALGALFGGGEKIDKVAFEAGAARLTPPEREKLVRIAAAMAKRPKLVLAAAGSYAASDRVALQDLQLRRALLARSGQPVPEKGDPGPVTTQQPKIRDALEALYKERFGASDLAALKDGFRNANPGQLEEGIAGKMMSRLSGLLREKKTLSASEVAQLKGADFHAVLYERLRAGEAVGDERLQALAQARGEHALEILKTAGVAPDRLQLRPPERLKDEERGDEEHGDDEVPLRLALEPAKIN